MASEIIFVRHGQSEGNIRHLFYGHTDGSLTALGLRQAELVADYLAGTKIDAVYSSDLLRARQTAAPTLLAHGLTLRPTRALREIYAGEWENRAFEELRTRFPESYGDVWLHNIGLAAPDGGESVAALEARVIDFVRETASQSDGKTLAFFTHATPIRAFFNRAYGRTLAEMKDLPWATNASVSRVRYENGGFTVLSYSEDGYLGDTGTALPRSV